MTGSGIDKRDGLCYDANAMAKKDLKEKLQAASEKLRALGRFL